MVLPRRLLSSYTPVLYKQGLAMAAGAVALLLCSHAYGATFGHSRILSAPGKPLAIDVAVRQLSEADAAALVLRPAPAAAWAQAGLTPPVDLDSLTVQLANGIAPGSKVIQVRSTQPFTRPVADLLLDLNTASGQQRYQVSLLAQGTAPAIRAPATSGTAIQTPPASTSLGSDGAQPTNEIIAVKRGDTMLSIARRNAVADVTIYQLMIGLQKANPQAFIHGNLNLVKAGARLAVPDASVLTAVSDAEARRIFRAHALAFAQYGRGSGARVATLPSESAVSAGVVQQDTADGTHRVAANQGDQLRLSDSAPIVGTSAAMLASTDGLGAGTKAPVAYAATGTAPLGSGSSAHTSISDDRLATTKGIADTEGRVSQLEENVKNLNRALQSQGEAAKDLVLEGAKGISQSLSEMTGTLGDPSYNTQTTDSTRGGSPAAQSSSTGTDDVGSSSDIDRADSLTDSVSQKADHTMSWLQEHMLALIAGALALMVLLLAWVLRRANAARDDASGISPAMVKQKLDQINLDLAQPAADDFPRARNT